MAEEKKNGKTIEITFKLKDHLTNTGIGNAEIELYSKTGNKFSKKGKSSNNGIVKITIDEEDLKKKLYVKLVQSDDYYEYPFPNSTLPTYAICYRRDRTQEIRFLIKRCVVGIVKAYNHQIGSIYSSESEYLSNWQDEILTIDKEQTITLKAFIVSNISEEGIREPNGRYFLNNSELEDEFSANIYWAFTIVDNIAGFKTVKNPNSSSSTDANNTTNQTNTSNNQTANTTDNNTNASNDSNNPNINNIIDIDTSALTRKIVNSNGEYLYLNQKQTEKTLSIGDLEILNKKLDYNLLKQFKIYKLMKSGEEVTGHTINFKLSDVISDDLLNTEGFLDRFCIIFFAYIKEDNQNSNNTDNNAIEVKYYSGKDSVPSIELKMVANKYSMVFDGYHLELYKNGKYIKNFEAKLMLDGKYIDHDSFPFMPLSKQKYIGLDDLYICKPSAFNKVNYVTNQVTDIAHKIMDSFKNNKISDNATTNNMPLDNATSNSIVLDNATTNNTTNNNLNNVNYNQDNDSLITNYIRTYMNMLSLSEPQYSIISNDNQKKDNTKNNTGTNTKGSINHIIDEKILHDKNIILQNLHQTSSSNNNGYKEMKNDMIKLNNSISLSSNNFKSLISMLNFQNDILVKVIYQPKYVIEVTRYKEKYNYDTSTLDGRYGATYGVFAVYVYYMGEKFLLDSVIDMYNSKYKDDENKVIDKDNIIRENIEELNKFVNDFKNHDSIKTDMYEKDLQNKATYGNLIYGGYTMEPAGPDCITSNLKRRIPEGHYKGKFNTINRVSYQNNTMRLYNDTLNQYRGILIHAGSNNIKYTTGCVLVSSQSYITGNDNITKSQNTKNLLYNLYLFLYNIAIAPKENKANNKLSKKNENKPLEKGKELSQYINVVIRNKFEKFGE